MMCEDIIEILSKAIFSDDKQKLLRKIIDEPERFTGLLRPTKPYGKVIQFLLQSHEIRFGNAIQQVIGYIIRKLGYRVEMEAEYRLNDETLVIDMIVFRNPALIIEMKIRDDHDSSKKRGQITNFEKKIEAFVKSNPEANVEGVFWFVDPTMRKNEDYYKKELAKISAFYKLNTHLLYGRELFDFLGEENIWDSFIDCLKLWKTTIPDLPNVDYDENVNDTINLLENLSLADWRKLIENDELWEENGIITRLFRSGESLRAICNTFENYKERRLREQYIEIARKLRLRLEKLYGSSH